MIFTLNNGVTIPAIGFGTWQISNEDVYEAVLAALKAGYRHIDTAMGYNNEEGVGRAIKDSGIPREEIFITTKLPANIKGFDETLEAFQSSLDRLGVETIDLYLIHAPKPWGSQKDAMEYMDQNIASWKAFEKLYQEGKIRSIGVSNFLPNHLDALIQATDIVPMVNQISASPLIFPKENIIYCKKKGILVEAYSPLGTGRVFNNEQLQSLAKKYNLSIAQLCIRWCIQHDLLPLPKSVTPERIIENLQVFDFVIEPEDMELLNQLSK